MKVNKISAFCPGKLHKTSYASRFNTQKTSNSVKMLSGFSAKFIPIEKSVKSISFLGRTVHIVDGGNHATNMQHFANAISNDMDIEMHEVETNKNDKNTKQLSSLEQELKKLNKQQSFNFEYVAIPALASVPILNIQDQYNAIMNRNEKFTPQNLKANKSSLLSFLKEIYDNPKEYEKYIGYMDPNKQGIEHVYGVISEINKLVEKGARVYVPSGHPQDETLKWLAGERGLKPELYHFIATNIDHNNVVHDMHKEIKDNNWYDFNLLALSDANIVGVKGASGAQDYMFAAYDSCITDGERGVYNFSPVRKDGQLVGYSYTDTTTNQYPFNEFPANNEIENIAKYVGKNYEEVVASPKEITELCEARANNLDTQKCPDKLYPVNRVFEPNEIKQNKIELKGKYVDNSLKLFFDKNNQSEIIFPQCDCEGSGKPSVLSMWGSCFAVFNAIKKDIVNSYKNSNFLSLYEHEQNKEFNIKKGAEKVKQFNFDGAEYCFKRAIECDDIYAKSHKGYLKDYLPHKLLGEMYDNCGRHEWAQGCYNNALDILSKKIKVELDDIANIKKQHDVYKKSKIASEKYERECREYNSKSALFRFFATTPKKPSNYGLYKNMREDEAKYLKLSSAAHLFEKIADNCERKQEDYPAKVCRAAARDILNGSAKGKDVIERRSKNVQYIGDLYPEIT